MSMHDKCSITKTNYFSANAKKKNIWWFVIQFNINYITNKNS